MRMNDDFFYLPAVATFSFNCQALIPKKYIFFSRYIHMPQKMTRKKCLKIYLFLLDEGYMKAFFNNLTFLKKKEKKIINFFTFISISLRFSGTNIR